MLGALDGVAVASEQHLVGVAGVDGVGEEEVVEDENVLRGPLGRVDRHHLSGRDRLHAAIDEWRKEMKERERSEFSQCVVRTKRWRSRMQETPEVSSRLRLPFSLPSQRNRNYTRHSPCHCGFLELEPELVHQLGARKAVGHRRRWQLVKQLELLVPPFSAPSTKTYRFF